jgi:hypothetical protein
MESRELRLSSLFLSLFFESGELWRFARHTFGESVAFDLDPKGQLTEQAERLAQRVSTQGRVDHALFDALVKSRPENRETIEQVREELLGEQLTRGASRGVSEAESGGETAEPISDDRRAWRRRVASLLASASLEPPEPAPEWLEAAAVLAGFSPLELRPAGGAAKAPGDLLERLAAVCDVLPDGRLSLRLEKRQEVLARLVREGRLAAALDANPDASVHGRVLRRAVEEGRIEPRELRGHAELKAAHDVAEWLARSGFEPFDRDRLAARLDRQRRIEPLRRLIGEHFRGREEELASLRRHFAGEPGPPILSLWGIGGVGKSALLGYVLLDLERRRVPWAYLDFDHPEVDPMQPRRLVELIARQLAQFFDDAGAASSLLALESAAAGDDLSFTLDIDREADVETFLAAMDGSLREVSPEPRLILVLDTFEQVQVRGARAVEVLRGLVDAILEAMPYARVVVSGRAAAPWDDAGVLGLEDLDEESADEVLATLGVDDARLRGLVVDRVGTSPLSLRLAADALAADQLGPSDMEQLVLHVSELERQGQLYTRILGHIREGEVRRLAHPGLIVRRVTPAVIRDVLAEVCEIDPGRAEAVFDRLPGHVTLFEPDEAAAGEGRALRHRQDVREKMLRLMIRDPQWVGSIAEIHRRAVDHYAGRDDDVARAEEIYHRLMRDDDPELFDHRWGPELAVSLGRCWEEPLPDRARAWLGPRIGQTHGDLEAWRTQDWEVSAEREARARLQSDDPEGALAVLQKREERTPGSPLHRLEVEALTRLRRWDEGRETVDRALASASEAGRFDETLRLHLLGAEIALHCGDVAGLDAHLSRALENAERMGDAGAQMEVWELRLRAARERGGDEQAIRRRLEQVFLKAEDAKLRQDPDLSRRLLRELGAVSAPVLRKAAAAFGNRADQTVIRPDAFMLGDLLERFKASPAGKQELSRLAGEVGLSKRRFKVKDLASHAIRYGKLGDALVTVLDHRGGDDELRLGAARMFRDLGG